jgi:phosphatidylglycerophosphate synthase
MGMEAEPLEYEKSPKFEYEKSIKKVSSYPFVQRYLPLDRYAIRPPASLVVKAVFKTRVTPNQLTLTSFFLALLAALAFAGGRHGLFVLGGCLSLLSTIFDAADGMLARAKALTSRYGAYLDLFLDRIADFAVMAGASFGCYRHSGDWRFLAFGLLTIGLYFLQLCLYYINKQYTRSEKSGEGAEAKSAAVFLIFITSLAGHPEWFLAGIFVLGVVSVISKWVRFLRKGKDAAAAPAA